MISTHSLSPCAASPRNNGRRDSTSAPLRWQKPESNADGWKFRLLPWMAVLVGVAKSKTPKPKAPKPRNLGTWTEAGFWSRMRSQFRRMFLYNWKPAQIAWERSRRAYTGPKNGNQKWEHQCTFCHKWFLKKNVELDHLIPCGSLNCWEDVVPFLQKLLIEDPDGYAVLCKECHGEKTEGEKEAKLNLQLNVKPATRSPGATS